MCYTLQRWKNIPIQSLNRPVAAIKFSTHLIRIIWIAHGSTKCWPRQGQTYPFFYLKKTLIPLSFSSFTKYICKENFTNFLTANLLLNLRWVIIKDVILNYILCSFFFLVKYWFIEILQTKSKRIEKKIPLYTGSLSHVILRFFCAL